MKRSVAETQVIPYSVNRNKCSVAFQVLNLLKLEQSSPASEQKFLSLGAYNLESIKRSCNLKTDLDSARVWHSSDIIFVSLAKLFNRNSNFSHR